jgi:hypothetical protein
MAIGITGGLACYDSSIRTFFAEVDGVIHGKFEGDIPTIGVLEGRIGFALSADERAMLQAEFDATIESGQPSHRIISKVSFMALFTMGEKRAIYGAESVSVDIRIWLEEFRAATEIDLDYPPTVGGLQALEAAGILAAGRANEIRGIA